MDRPVTSKSRGICRYYMDPRGCFAGARCKFTHGDPLVVKHTPFDMAKSCKYYLQGYCRRGDKCWFQHVNPDSPTVEDPIDEQCSICFEHPSTYGLLAGCSHVFCLECIKQWRDNKGKSEDVKWSGTTKKCPMCRTPSKFITPSSAFYRSGDEAKDRVVAAYLGSMARVPCRYFQASMSTPQGPFCPFGADCFYQHLNADGSPHTFLQGVDVCMQMRSRRRSIMHSGPPDVLPVGLVDVIRAGFRGENRENNLWLVDRILGNGGRDLLNDVELVGTLLQSLQAIEGVVDDLLPPLEPIDLQQDDNSSSGLPDLQDVDQSSNDDDDDSSDSYFSPVEDVDERNDHIDEVVNAERPPFVTDGRGRVIGTTEEAESPSLLRRVFEALGM